MVKRLLAGIKAEGEINGWNGKGETGQYGRWRT